MKTQLREENTELDTALEYCAETMVGSLMPPVEINQTLSLCAGDRTNSEGVRMEFKSKQWFGASVRSDGEHIMVRTSAGDLYMADRTLKGTLLPHDPDHSIYKLCLK